MTTPHPTPPKLPLVLLGLNTVNTFVGPILLLVLIRGGQRPEWPPDRPVEWWALGVVVGLGVVLTSACVVTSLRSRKGTG